MRFAAYKSPRGPGLAIALPEGEFRGIDESDAMFPGRLEDLIAEGTQALQAAGERLARGRRIDPQALVPLQEVQRSPAITNDFLDGAGRGRPPRSIRVR